MKAVYLKEIKTYFTNMVLYSCYALMFLIAGIYTWAYNIQGASGSFEYTVSGMSFLICMLTVPLLTMRVFAEERRQKTDQLLYCLPLKSTSIVTGKYLSAITVFSIPVLVFAAYPLIFARYGNVNVASGLSVLFAFFFMSAAFIAIGVFISSLVENQIVAAVITAAVIFFNNFIPGIASYASKTALTSAVFLVILGILLGFIVFLMTKNYLAGLLTAAVIDFILILLYVLKPEMLEGILPNVLTNISLFACLDNFTMGVFDVTKIVFYISVAAVFIFMTVQSLEKRRWE